MTSLLRLMALIGSRLGIPVAIGMPGPGADRGRALDRFLLAFTVGLLGFLGIEALLEGTELAGGGPEVLGGAALVWLGAVGAYVALAGIDAWLRGRVERTRSAEPKGGGARLGERAAFLVALGIGLHNLGEGLAIGSAYAIGSLALGAALVVGFALHNTTEGLAIVAPVALGSAGCAPWAAGPLAGAQPYWAVDRRLVKHELAAVSSASRRRDSLSCRTDRTGDPRRSRPAAQPVATTGAAPGRDVRDRRCETCWRFAQRSPTREGLRESDLVVAQRDDERSRRPRWPRASRSRRRRRRRCQAAASMGCSSASPYHGVSATPAGARVAWRSAPPRLPTLPARR